MVAICGIVPLSQNQIALVSPEDYVRLQAHKWYAMRDKDGRWQAVRNKPQHGGLIYMHREVMGASEGEWVDHINRNPLDNTRTNLRICNPSQNQGNRVPIGGFKGVSRTPDKKRWRARIGGRHLGRFDTPEEAAEAYDKAALLKWGRFARLNFPRRTYYVSQTSEEVQ